MLRWLILASLSLLVGCASTTANRGEKLADASRMLHAALAVRDFRTLASLLETRLQAAFLADSDAAERNLSITEIELLSMTMSADGEKAETVSRLSYFELPSTVVRTETIRVHWIYQEAEWRIERIEGGPLPLGTSPPHSGSIR